MDEEIKVRMGLDAGALMNGLKKAEGDLASFDETTKTVGASFLAAIGTGIAFAFSKLKEFNGVWDAMRDKNAKEFGNSAGAKDAVRQRSDDLKRAQKDFEAAIKEKPNEILDALDKEKAARAKVYELGQKQRDDEYLDKKRKIEDEARAAENELADEVRRSGLLNRLEKAGMLGSFNLKTEKAVEFRKIEEDQIRKTRALDDEFKKSNRLADDKKNLNDRASIQRAMDALNIEAQKTERERQEAEKDAASGRPGKLVDFSARATILQGYIDKLKTDIPKIEEKFSDLHSKDRGLDTILNAPFDPDLQIAPEKLKEELRKYQRELEKTKDAIAKLTDADKESNANLERKRAKIAELVQALATLAKERDRIQTPQSPPPSGMPGELDPETGGYKYHPLVYNPLVYHPLKGAPGYVDPKKPGDKDAPVRTVEQQLKEMTDHLSTLVELSTGRGLNTSPAMGK